MSKARTFSRSLLRPSLAHRKSFAIYRRSAKSGESGTDDDEMDVRSVAEG